MSLEPKPVPDFRTRVNEMLELAHVIISAQSHGPALVQWGNRDFDWDFLREVWLDNYDLHLGSTDD